MTKKLRDAALPNVDISLLLDRTGSMTTIWTETIMSVNAYVQKMLNDETIDARVMVTVFDRIGAVADLEVIRGWSVEGGWRDIQPNECPPRGNTPLYEAIGLSLSLLRAEWNAYKNKHNAGNHRVQFVVMTDGEENASSREWTHAAAKRVITECQNLPGWQVVFLGANIDAEKLGMSLGTQYGSTMSYTGNNTTNVFAESLHQNSRAFASTGQSQFSVGQRAAAVAPAKKVVK